MYNIFFIFILSQFQFMNQRNRNFCKKKKNAYCQPYYRYDTTMMMTGRHDSYSPHTTLTFLMFLRK